MALSLKAAVEDGDMRMLRRLIEQGADVDSTDDNGKTALHHAARRWEIPILHFKLNTNIILIIHASECISGSASCIEDIYNDANRTSRGGGGGGEFGLHNIVNVRNHVATPLMHEEISVLLVL